MADDNSTLQPAEEFVPEQVKRAAARAEELQKQFAQDYSGEQPPSEGAPEPQREPPLQREPLPEGEPAPGPAPGPAHSPEWEQRYRTLQGKYDAETSQLRGQVQAMERLLGTMQAPPPQPGLQQATTVVPAGPAAYNEQDVELYGQDLLDAVARAAEARYGAQITDLQNQIRRLEGGQQSMTNTAHQDRVFRELDNDPEISSYWRQLNTDPRFLEWLQGVDEFSGLPRNTMMQHAYVNGDVTRTGRFFKKYLQEHTVPPSNATAPHTGGFSAPNFNSGNGSLPAGRPRLEDLAAPGRAAGANPGNGAQSPRIWSRSDIRAFYRDRTAGKFRGREADAERLEADLFAADREGRIQ